MKLVNGKVTSTKPISLPKAAKFLSEFLSSRDAALGPLSSYLISASSSFNELVQTRQKLEKNRPLKFQAGADNVEEERPTKVEPDSQEKWVKNVEFKENRKHKKKKGLEEGIEDEKLIKTEPISQQNLVENVIEIHKHKNRKKSGEESIGSEKLVRNEKTVADIEEGGAEKVKSKKKKHGPERVKDMEPKKVEEKLEDAKKMESLEDGLNEKIVGDFEEDRAENAKGKKKKHGSKSTRDMAPKQVEEKLGDIKRVEFLQDDGRKVDTKEKKTEGVENLETKEEKRKEKRKRKSSQIENMEVIYSGNQSDLNKKKRKIREVANGEVFDSGNRSNLNEKKRRKIGDDE